MTSTSLTTDLVDLVGLTRANPDGISAREAAQALYETDQPIPHQRQMARARLERLVKRRLLVITNAGRYGERRYGVAEQLSANEYEAEQRFNSADKIAAARDGYNLEADRLDMLAAQNEALIGLGTVLLEVVRELRAIRKAVAEGTPRGSTSADG